jgi:hypothetical protein
MKKETAVEWLVDAIRSNLEAGKLNAVCISGLKMHAKAMEKEQIVNTWYDCKLSIVDKKPMDAEEYYNETYK